MRRKIFILIGAFALLVISPGCTVRRTADRVSQGVHGPSSPAESGQHGDTAFNRPPYGVTDAEHQTAGLTGEITNGKVDETMEGSGNIAWQGSFERQKRAKMQASAATAPAGRQTQQSPQSQKTQQGQQNPQNPPVQQKPPAQ